MIQLDLFAETPILPVQNLCIGVDNVALSEGRAESTHKIIDSCPVPQEGQKSHEKRADFITQKSPKDSPFPSGSVLLIDGMECRVRFCHPKEDGYALSLEYDRTEGSAGPFCCVNVRPVEGEWRYGPHVVTFAPLTLADLNEAEATSQKPAEIASLCKDGAIVRLKEAQSRLSSVAEEHGLNGPEYMAQLAIVAKALREVRNV